MILPAFRVHLAAIAIESFATAGEPVEPSFRLSAMARMNAPLECCSIVLQGAQLARPLQEGGLKPRRIGFHGQKAVE
jgi:hypothetical protein